METHIQVKKPKMMAFVLMLSAFIGLFGETALNMALSNVMEDYTVTAGTAQWLTTGYLLVLAILVPISALLIRWFSTKTLVFTGIIISLIGAILAGLSPNFPVLLIGRLVQAIGTGLILPVMTNVMLLIFPIHKRGLVMGIMGLVITTAPAIGPTLSGVIISTLGWSYIFWFSAIFYVLLFFLALVYISNVSEITKPKIDVLSILLSTLGFGGLVFGLSTMAETAFSSPEVWGTLLIGVISLILFIVRQLTMKQPMLNLRVFKYPMFTLGTLTLFLSIVIILSTAILLPMYLKGSLLYTAAVAGLLLLPGNFVNLLLTPIIGAFFDKIGPRKFVITGTIFVLIGNIIFVSTIASTTPVWQIVVAFIVLFIGLSMTTMPSQTNALNQLPRQLYADGSAVQNTLNQVAGAVGTAIAITLFITGQNNHAADFPTAQGPEILAAGVKYAFYTITGISVITFILSFFVKTGVPDKQ